jgi:HSP20 family molecular chaperone IbpA
MDTTKKQRSKGKIIIVPPTGIGKNERTICIISHLQGIPEDEIRIDLERTQLIISAPIQNKKVLQKITVPEGSQIIKKKFDNGILEIVLDRP